MLRGRERHELSCATCGAPLHDLKMLPQPRQKTVKKTHSQAPRRYEPRKTSKRKIKKRKSLFSRLVEEAWDVVDDVFD